MTSSTDLQVGVIGTGPDRHVRRAGGDADRMHASVGGTSTPEPDASSRNSERLQEACTLEEAVAEPMWC